AEREAQRVSLCRNVPFQFARTAQIGVADGKYRISLRISSYGWKTESTRRIGTLLEMDPPDPSEVEVAGTMKELPIHARLVQEIQMLEPAAAAPADLRRDFFRWTPVDGASYYDVSFTYQEDRPQGTTTFAIGSIRTESPSLCLGTSTARQIKDVRANLVA